MTTRNFIGGAPVVIAVDFDGTLFKDKYPLVGEPIYPVINYIKRAKEEGNKIILWTCRQGRDLAVALEACNQIGLTFDAVNCILNERIERHNGNNSRKVGADLYIDDKAVRPEEL